MPNIFQLLPTLEGEEMQYVQSLINDMTDTQAQQFAMAYGARRKDPTTILILALKYMYLIKTIFIICFNINITSINKNRICIDIIIIIK